MPVRKLKYKSRMDHSHLKFQKLGKKIRKTCWLSIINHFFPNKLVETSGDCEWTDNFEDTGRRQTIQTYNTHTHTIRPTPTCCPQLSAPLSKPPPPPPPPFSDILTTGYISVHDRSPYFLCCYIYKFNIGRMIF